MKITAPFVYEFGAVPASFFRANMRNNNTFVKRMILSLCGLLAKSPLYNLFVQEAALFEIFMDHFTSQINKRLLKLLEEGITLADIKNLSNRPSLEKERNADLKKKELVASSNWKNLLKLSKREKECLLYLQNGYTYQGIGEKLNLSERTVEHYIESVKNKLNIDTRPELYNAAQKIVQFELQ